MISLSLRGWLLKRIQGFLILQHHGNAEEDGIRTEIDEEARRGQQLILFTVPLLSGLLSPGASLQLDLSWGTPALQHMLVHVHVHMPHDAICQIA